MFKKTGFIPVLIMIIMFAMATTAFAAGWAMQDNYTVYYDDNNNLVCEKWIKDDTDKWHWLDGNGHMAVNQIVDEKYFVNANGEMVIDTWVKIPDSSGQQYWYYFGSTGKMYAGGAKEIEGSKYYFDDEGRMQTGWILDNQCYADENGKLKIGWAQLQDPETDDQNESPDGLNVHYYYFQASGKKLKAEGNFMEKRIDGVKYCFDNEGRMRTGWINMYEGDEDDGISGWRYYNADGSLRTGWYSLNPPEQLENNYEQDVVWFYFNNSGEPACTLRDKYYSEDMIRINGKKYLFNKWGTPLYGLQKVDDTAYYFGTSSQCTPQSGRMSLTQAGTKTDFYFTKSGEGLTGVNNHRLYYMGKLQKADPSMKYDVVKVKGTKYVITTQGNLVRNKSVKNGDGVKLTASAQGILEKVDDGSPDNFPATEPEPPEFE